MGVTPGMGFSGLGGIALLILKSVLTGVVANSRVLGTSRMGNLSGPKY